MCRRKLLVISSCRECLVIFFLPLFFFLLSSFPSLSFLYSMLHQTRMSCISSLTPGAYVCAWCMCVCVNVSVSVCVWCVWCVCMCACVVCYKYIMLFISIRASLLQRYISAYDQDVASNKVATPWSVPSRIAYIFCVTCYWRNNKNEQLQIPFISLRSPINVLHSVLVR